jgi:hypothetical protein
MLRNIYHHYPVKLLPPDLSEGFEPEMTVTVTIETEGDFAKDLIGLECVMNFVSDRSSNYPSAPSSYEGLIR